MFLSIQLSIKISTTNNSVFGQLSYFFLKFLYHFHFNLSNDDVNPYHPTIACLSSPQYFTPLQYLLISYQFDINECEKRKPTNSTRQIFI